MAQGTIESVFEGGRLTAFKVKCEPHVEAKILRWFQGSRFSAKGFVRVSNTPEHCRDLEMLLGRFELTVPTDTHEAIVRASAEHVAIAQRVAAIASGAYAPRVVDLAIPLRPYQSVGAEIHIQRRRLLNGDEIGIGKTATAIAVIAATTARPALVVTLTTLPSQWAREIQRFAPGLRTHILRGCRPYDLAELPTDKRRRKTPTEQSALPGVPDRLLPDVVITSYSKVASWAASLAGLVQLVVFDEAQELRHAGTAKYDGAARLSEGAQYVLGLTGSPIYNYGSEFFPVLDCISPGCLGDEAEFLRGWCVGEGRTAKIKDPKVFGKYLRDEGLMIRRTRAEIGNQLPPVSRIVETVSADMEALNAVGQSARELAKAILERSGTWEQRGHVAEEFSNVMRQATGLAKAPYVAQFVRLLLENDKPVILFGWHHSCYEVWRSLLKDLEPVFITGQESPAAKQRAFDAFTQGRTKLLIMSLRSGPGLDGLQHVCSTVVFGELDWSPEVINQDIGRVARDGQTDPVFAYFPVSDHGADPTMIDVLGIKREQAHGVLNPDAAMVERMESSGGHLKELARRYLHQTPIEGEEAAA